MANIRVNVGYEIKDGCTFMFNAPCDCTAVNGLTVYHTGGSKTFGFRDAHGNSLVGIGNLFSAGALVNVVLDVTNSMAYIQNADTNSYLEAELENAKEKIREQNTGSDMTFWIGTTDEYKAQETKAKNCFYILSDDENRPLSGTWVPDLTQAAGFRGTSVGYYFKIGKLVYIQIAIAGIVEGGEREARLSLPFPAAIRDGISYVETLDGVTRGTAIIPQYGLNIEQNTIVEGTTLSANIDVYENELRIVDVTEARAAYWSNSMGSLCISGCYLAK